MGFNNEELKSIERWRLLEDILIPHIEASYFASMRSLAMNKIDQKRIAKEGLRLDNLGRYRDRLRKLKSRHHKNSGLYSVAVWMRGMRVSNYQIGCGEDYTDSPLKLYHNGKFKEELSMKRLYNSFRYKVRLMGGLRLFRGYDGVRETLHPDSFNYLFKTAQTVSNMIGKMDRINVTSGANLVAAYALDENGTCMSKNPHGALDLYANNKTNIKMVTILNPGNGRIQFRALLWRLPNNQGWYADRCYGADPLILSRFLSYLMGQKIPLKLSEGGKALKTRHLPIVDMNAGNTFSAATIRNKIYKMELKYVKGDFLPYLDSFCFVTDAGEKVITLTNSQCPSNWLARRDIIDIADGADGTKARFVQNTPYGYEGIVRAYSFHEGLAAYVQTSNIVEMPTGTWQDRDGVVELNSAYHHPNEQELVMLVDHNREYALRSDPSVTLERVVSKDVAGLIRHGAGRKLGYTKKPVRCLDGSVISGEIAGAHLGRLDQKRYGDNKSPIFWFKKFCTKTSLGELLLKKDVFRYFGGVHILTVAREEKERLVKENAITYYRGRWFASHLIFSLNKQRYLVSETLPRMLANQKIKDIKATDKEIAALLASVPHVMFYNGKTKQSAMIAVHNIPSDKNLKGMKRVVVHEGNVEEEEVLEDNKPSISEAAVNWGDCIARPPVSLPARSRRHEVLGGGGQNSYDFVTAEVGTASSAVGVDNQEIFTLSPF